MPFPNPTPGEMRHLITVQTMTTGQDARGGPTETASTYVQLYAQIIPAAAGERFQGAQMVGQRLVRFLTRYYAGITSKMRISWSSRLFDIQSVVNIEEANRFLEITTTERSA